MQIHLLTLLLLLLPTLTLTQSIYIDLIPAYRSLACCAQPPLSAIVRGMSKGCGDNSALTSYACFCTSSSSYMSAQISSYASLACNGNVTQANQAVGVFESYCAVGTVTKQATLVLAATTAASCTGSINSTTSSARPAGTGVITAGASATAPPPASTSTTTSAASLNKRAGLELNVLSVLVVGILAGSVWF